MSTETITCSLARLALCKAIKTPDADDFGAEPWNRSVIFHQSHIRQDMRDSIQSPDFRQTRTSVPTNRTPKFQRPRSDERRVPVAITPVPSVSVPFTPRKNMSADRTSSETVNQSAVKTRRFLPSNNKDVDDGSNMASDDELAAVVVLPKTHKPSDLHVASIVKPGGRTIPQPSDDEEEDEEDEDKDDDDEEGSSASQRGGGENGKDNGDARKPFNRPLSDQGQKDPAFRPNLAKVRQTSLHNRSRSTGDMDRMIPSRNSTPTPNANGQLRNEPIEQWRKSLLYVPDQKTPLVRHASPRPSSGGSHHSFTEGASREAIYSRPASTPATAHRQRLSGLSDINMMSYQAQQHRQQQQQQQHLQLQAQQQVQIQQYHHAAQASQTTSAHLQTPADQHRRRSNNRLSLSGMDLLIQRENEKAEMTRKPKRIDPSKAPIDGMLGRLPETGMHNINFQAGTIPNNRSANAAIATRHANHARRSRSPGPKSILLQEGNRKMTSTDARRRAEMMRGDINTPVPVPSTSAPIFSQPMMISQPLYGQYLTPAMGRMNMNMAHSLGMPIQIMSSQSTNRRPISMMNGQSIRPQFTNTNYL